MFARAAAINCVSAPANCHCPRSRWPTDCHPAAPRPAKTDGRCLRAAVTHVAPPETRCAPKFAFRLAVQCTGSFAVGVCLSRHRTITATCASSLPYLAYRNRTQHSTTLWSTKANLAGLGARIVVVSLRFTSWPIQTRHHPRELNAPCMPALRPSAGAWWQSQRAQRSRSVRHPLAPLLRTTIRTTLPQLFSACSTSSIG